MGDLVRSERAADPDRLHAAFNATVSTENARHADALASPLTITLGDEFQGLATTLAAAARIARDLRLSLMDNGIDCRFVIGTAAIKTPINPAKAWNMLGPGLAEAREKLNEKKPDRFYRFTLAGSPLIEELLDALGAGLSTIERGWTDRQRADIAVLLGGATPSELADTRKVSVHSVYKVRSSGHYDTYRLQWQAIEAALGEIDREAGLNR